MADINREVGKRLTFIFRIKTYFMYGHGNWTGVLVSITTFMLVLFDFAALHMTGIIPDWMMQPHIFFPVVFLSYSIPVVLLGWLSYHRGEVAVRYRMDWEYNPAYQDLMKKIEYIERLLEERKDVPAGIH